MQQIWFLVYLKEQKLILKIKQKLPDLAMWETIHALVIHVGLLILTTDVAINQYR